jgi:hypothetical protein
VAPAGKDNELANEEVELAVNGAESSHGDPDG